MDSLSVFDMSGAGADDAAWTPSSMCAMPQSEGDNTKGRKHMRFRLGHRGRCTTNRSIPPVLPVPKSRVVTFLYARALENRTIGP